MVKNPIWTGDASNFIALQNGSSKFIKSIVSVIYKPTGLSITFDIDTGFGVVQPVIISCTSATNAGFSAEL